MSPRRAHQLLVAHVAVLCMLGQLYAKLDLGLYPTELVLGALLVLTGGAAWAIPRDALTRRIAVFLAFGAGCAVVFGLPAGAGVKACSFFVYAGFYAVVRAVATSERARWQILDAIAIASVVAAALGLWQMTTGVPIVESDKFGELGFEETSTGSVRWLSGEYGLYGMLGLITAAARPLARRRITPRSAVVLAAAAIELLLAQHRSGLVALGVAVAATGGYVLGTRRALAGALRLLALGVAGLAVTAIAVDSAYLDDTIARITHITDVQDVNTAWRLLNWYEVGAGVVDRPLGHGFAQWDFFFTRYDPLIGSHNSLLDLAYRIGVPGLVAFLAIPGWLLARTRRAVAASSGGAQVLPITACACVLAILVYACFNVVLETAYMSILFWVVLGVGAAALEAQAPAST
ncbi:MAG TPA: O-antigen ligase family protein [Kofleriaceae bacterium]|nr:O-antigen ligase family protein [Kofleriaceae bacterium]